MKASVDYQSTSTSARIPTHAWVFLLCGWSTFIIPTAIVRIVVGLYYPGEIFDVIKSTADQLAPGLSLNWAFRIMTLAPLAVIGAACLTCAIIAIRAIRHLQTRTAFAFGIAGAVLIGFVVLCSLAIIFILFMA